VIDGAGEPGQVLSSSDGRLLVAAGDGAVELVVVQVPGKRAMPATEFLNGHPVRPGDRMGDPHSSG
jgi:methionyl-tRNA formyltransferase